MAVSAYNSKWYEASVRCRKFILVMIRSREGKTMLGLNCIKIDLDTYKWVRRTKATINAILS